MIRPAANEGRMLEDSGVVESLSGPCYNTIDSIN